MMHPSDATPDRGKPSILRTRCRSHEQPKTEWSTTPAANRRPKENAMLSNSNGLKMMTPPPRIIKEPNSTMTDMTEPMTPFPGTPFENQRSTPLVSSQPSVAPMRAPIPPSASSHSSNFTPSSFSILQEGYRGDEEEDVSPLKGQYRSRALFQNETDNMTPFKSSHNSGVHPSSPPRGPPEDQGMRVLPEAIAFGTTQKSLSAGTATATSSTVNFIHNDSHEHTVRRHRSSQSQPSCTWEMSSQETFGIQERRRSNALRTSHDNSDWSLRSSASDKLKKHLESSIDNIEEPATPDTSSVSSTSPQTSPSRKEKAFQRQVTTRKSVASAVASVPTVSAIFSRMKRMKATEFFVLLCMMRLAQIFSTAHPPKAPKMSSQQDNHYRSHDVSPSSKQDPIVKTIRKAGGLPGKVGNASPAILTLNEFEMEDDKHKKRNHLTLKKLGAKHLDKHHTPPQTNNNNGVKEKKADVGNTKATAKMLASKTSTKTTTTKTVKRTLPMVVPPMGVLNDMPSTSNFFEMDSAFYNYAGDGTRRLDSPLPRTVLLDTSMSSESPPSPPSRTVELFPADFTDNTQFYGVLDSDDEKLSKMEMREPYVQGECVPMQKWQTDFHPSCNEMHGLGMSGLGHEEADDYFHLFGTGGFWRHAWRVDVLGGRKHLNDRESVVLKTLKLDHNFEDAHFEHDRIDAVAMERLTSSPHVINVFGFCGHSVLTEFADGKRVGQLADKAKKVPLSRLKIALDIASGLADVHGIDGDGNATFAHLDINPANVVSIGGTLKLNDFNIGQNLLWNTTSNKQCGFSNAQYPNPQWRSPEEAKEEMLTEKVDVFSMGHIFFRLICGHEPWNKLEVGGKPEKEVIHKKVVAGVLPFIPEHVTQTTDKEVIAIRDAMLQCYTYEPEKRPGARQIAQELDKALKKLSRTRTATHKRRRK